MAPLGSNILYLLDVYKVYGTKVVLDDIDLSVSRGELCTLVGPSGCGKSTLLRLILGQERPTRGEIHIEGKPVGFPNPERGVVYQKYSLFPHLTVLENVMLGKKLSAGLLERRDRLNEFREESEYYLGKVKLTGHLDKYPHELSGGMQQRVALAQALIMKPKIFLMDEPFGALDPGTREDMQIFLLKLWEEFKMTIFFVTHDLEEAVFLGTRILVLSHYYSDIRGNGAHLNRGAKIVFDYPLERMASSSKVKETAKFGRLIQQIRREGFDPEYLQNVEDFNLQHPDSFITLSRERMARS